MPRRGSSSPRRRESASPRRGSSSLSRPLPAAPAAPPRCLLRAHHYSCQIIASWRERRIFAFRLASYPKWVVCLRLLLECVFGTQNTVDDLFCVWVTLCVRCWTRSQRTYNSACKLISLKKNSACRLSPCLDAKFQISIFFPAPAWRLKSRRNKNTLRLLSVNAETNLMNLIRLQLDTKIATIMLQ